MYAPCRFNQGSAVRAGFCFETVLVPIDAAEQVFRELTHKEVALPAGDDLLVSLPGGSQFAAACELGVWLGLRCSAGISTGTPSGVATRRAPTSSLVTKWKLHQEGWRVAEPHGSGVILVLFSFPS